MHEFREKRKVRRLIYSPLALLLLFILIVLIGKGAFDMYRRQTLAEGVEVVAEGRLRDITDRENFLEAAIHRLSTPEGVEKALREKFNVHKSGENVVLLVSPKEEPPVSETSSFRKVQSWFSNFFDTRD